MAHLGQLGIITVQFAFVHSECDVPQEKDEKKKPDTEEQACY
jgi:hypothetical protein